MLVKSIVPLLTSGQLHWLDLLCDEVFPQMSVGFHKQDLLGLMLADDREISCCVRAVVIHSQLSTAWTVKTQHELRFPTPKVGRHEVIFTQVQEIPHCWPRARSKPAPVSC